MPLGQRSGAWPLPRPSAQQLCPSGDSLSLRARLLWEALLECLDASVPLFCTLGHSSWV